jgi:expansin (peptidoglycan-binding protein)
MNQHFGADVMNILSVSEGSPGWWQNVRSRFNKYLIIKRKVSERGY